eukprot:5057-Heterococcus_DN1.PRE.2
MMNKGFGGKPRVPKFKYTGSVRPGAMSPTRPVPAEIMRPEYADTGKVVTNPPRFPWVIEEKTAHDIECMRAAGKIAREVLDAAGRAVRPGVTTDEIDAIVHAETIARDSYPSTLNYHGFTKSCCTSVNEIVCHGIPDSTVLKEGDIVNIDVTCYHNGYHGDCSEMFCVGEVDATSKELIQVTYDAWQAAAAFCKPGRKYQDIGAVIQDYVEARGFTTVRNFVGHGIGKVFHTNPNILHYRNNEPNGTMKAGHVFTIEPMICAGKPDNVVWPDNWTAATKDGKRTAQFEHTFLLTENGVQALTGKLATSPRQWWERDGAIGAVPAEAAVAAAVYFERARQRLSVTLQKGVSLSVARCFSKTRCLPAVDGVHVAPDITAHMMLRLLVRPQHAVAVPVVVVPHTTYPSRSSSDQPHNSCAVV